MLTLFNKIQRRGEKTQGKSHKITREPEPEIQDDTQPRADEASLKKSIATKLQQYRPVEREANFTGPKYYQ